MRYRRRRHAIGWAAAALLLLPLGAAILAPPQAEAAPRANPARGKVFYRNNCRVCHDGNTAGVKTLEPITKTMDQWQRDFDEGGAVAACHPRVREKVGAELTERDLLDIQAYLVQHAADSDQPATCGN